VTVTAPVPPPAGIAAPPATVTPQRVLPGLVTMLVDEPHPAMAANAAKARKTDPFTADRDARARPNARHVKSTLFCP
jgi:hypothetical protein